MAQLKENFEKKGFAGDDFIGFISFDEMKIQEGIIYNVSRFELVGFSEQTETEKSLLHKETKDATHVLNKIDTIQFMIRYSKPDKTSKSKKIIKYLESKAGELMAKYFCFIRPLQTKLLLKNEISS